MTGALAGKRVLVTRALHQASALGAALEREGASVVVIPAIEIVPPASFCGLDAALTTLRAYDWLLFTSANAVEAFTARARRLGVSPVARRVAVIGPATAKAVLEAGVAARIDLQPDRFIAEGLLEALLPYTPGSSMLLVHAEQARDVLVNGLREAGAQVTVAVAYRTLVPSESVARLRTLLDKGEERLHAATFTSASSVTNLRMLLERAERKLPSGIALVSIGPVTSCALADAGWTPTVEAEEATIVSLAAGLVRHFAKQ